MLTAGLAMRQPRSIAVAQTCPVKGDVATNLQEHIRLAHRAASQGAQIVVFPELSLTGYEIGLARDLAFSEDDQRLLPLIETAATAAVVLVVGAPVRLGSQLHIGAFVLFPDRKTALYTKHRLGAFGESARCDGIVPPAEATVFLPGDRNPLIHFGLNTAAVAVCADIGRPSHPQQAAERGANTYLASMFVIPSEFDGDAAKLERYAVTHSMVTALANFGSTTGGLAAAGRSGVWSQAGKLLVQLPAQGAGVATATETDEGWRVNTLMLGDIETKAPV
jgi:predicted amidohydrolase